MIIILHTKNMIDDDEDSYERAQNLVRNGIRSGEVESPRNRGLGAEPSTAWINRKRDLRTKRAVAKCRSLKLSLDEAMYD